MVNLIFKVLMGNFQPVQLRARSRHNIKGLCDSCINKRALCSRFARSHLEQAVLEVRTDGPDESGALTFERVAGCWRDVVRLVNDQYANC
jgi:hypothetical protein